MTQLLRVGYRQNGAIALNFFKLNIMIRFSKICLQLLLVTLAFPVNAQAAERAVFKLSEVQQSVSIAELATFAQTGELSLPLQLYIQLAKQNPERIRNVLSKPITLDPIILSRVLNTPVGDILLDQIGSAIRTPANIANRQTLRSALILSATDDRQVSLIELMQNYPSEEIIIEGDRLLEAFSTLSRFGGQVRGILEQFPF